MSISQSIQGNLKDFQEIVRSLSDTVNNASVSWQDEVYSSLQSSISDVASASRSVFTAGMQACNSFDRIENILRE